MDNADQPPPSLQVLINELSDPSVLHCPADLQNAATTNWDQVDWSKIDYALLPGVDWSNPTNIVCECRIHNNFGLAQGSVTLGGYRSGWPYITAGPLQVDATPGENVHFEFRYASDAVLPVAFQWRKEALSYVTNVIQVSNPDNPTEVYWYTNIMPKFTASDLLGETNTTLVLSNVHNSEIEFYSIAVSNAMGICSSHPSGLRADSLYAGVTTNEHWSLVFCVNNLRMIGLGRSLWAIEHNDQLALSFQSMTNYDGSPLLGWPVALFCRADTNRAAPADWAAVDYSNTSYEMMNGDPQNPFAMFCRCRVHGFYVQMDGDVVQQPSFSGIARKPDKTSELTFRVFAGRTNVLEASADLRNWSTVQTYDSALGEIQFTDSATADAQKFYRLRLK